MLRLALPALALVALTSPALAQYKVVAPDGRVTYTDRPPADASLKVLEMGRRAPAPAAPAGPALPLELQRLSQRYPVTLFTTSECAPCETGREMLRQRGVPYEERLVTTNDDIAALERTVGSRSLPALTVGGQALRGYSEADWASYLDAAGYPRESQLPRGWTPPAPTPLVARAPVPAPRQAAPETAPEPATPTAEAAAPPAPPIKF